VVNAVETGDIKQFFVIGGCDGAEVTRGAVLTRDCWWPAAEGGGGVACMVM
jgi:hypothetical protein